LTVMTKSGAVIITAESVTKTFATQDGRALPVLDGVSFTLAEGEILALLGKSGSGKSTLLRCVARADRPHRRHGRLPGHPAHRGNPGVAMVFQTFALLPWLTVQQNVELGLEARGVPDAARAERALAAIDTIGLDGFESAYPKELSGGMRQRVGFARAIVTEPDALLMDEPFSALDVLTAENLRNELIKLWEGKGAPVKSILIVTHNIEEAVLLADRVLVLSSNPGRIRAELTVGLPRPRDRHAPRFEALVDTIYGILTTASRPRPPPSRRKPKQRPRAQARPADGHPGQHAAARRQPRRPRRAARNPRRPRRQDGLAEIADDLSFEIDDLLPLTDAAVLLHMARIDGSDIELTPEAGVRRRRHPREQAVVRPARRRARPARPHHRPGPRRHRGPHAARGVLPRRAPPRLLRTGGPQPARHRHRLGRYAELYDYDSDDEELTLEPGAADYSDRTGARLPLLRRPRRGNRLAGHQALFPGQLVDDGERHRDPLRGVDHDRDGRDVPAKLQQPVPVRRVVTVEAPDAALGGRAADPRGAQPPDDRRWIGWPSCRAASTCRP